MLHLALHRQLQEVHAISTKPSLEATIGSKCSSSKKTCTLHAQHSHAKGHERQPSIPYRCIGGEHIRQVFASQVTNCQQRTNHNGHQLILQLGRYGNDLLLIFDSQRLENDVHQAQHTSTCPQDRYPASCQRFEQSNRGVLHQTNTTSNSNHRPEPRRGSSYKALRTVHLKAHRILLKLLQKMISSDLLPRTHLHKLSRLCRFEVLLLTVRRPESRHMHSSPPFP